MKIFAYGLVITLAILHQDFWFWNDSTLVFGFMPVGLAYHGLYSVMASAVWAFVLFKAWPSHLDEFADSPYEEEARS